MGIKCAGIAYKPRSPIEDPRGLLSTLFHGRAEEFVEPPPIYVETKWGRLPTRGPDTRRFDPRNSQDVAVSLYRDSCWIINFDLVWGLLNDPGHADATHVWEVLGRPDLMIAFCRLDYSSSDAYAFIEAGQVTRCRWETWGELPMEFGTPKPVERPWLEIERKNLEAQRALQNAAKTGVRAESYGDAEVDESESDTSIWRTPDMLRDVLLTHLGVCPWLDCEEQSSTLLFEIHDRIEAKGRS